MKALLPAILRAFSPVLMAGALCLLSSCSKGRQGSQPNPEAMQTKEGQSLGPLNTSLIPTADSEEHVPARAMNLEDKIVQLVRDWYKANGMQAPTRIVIHEQKGTNWIVLAGPQWMEMGFEVDPTANRVIRAVGD